MGEFQTIETQEQLDAVIGERLNREREKYKGFLSPEDVNTKYAGYLSPEDVEKKYAGYMSQEDIEKKYAGYVSAEDAAKKDAQIRSYENREQKSKIARELGLAYEAVEYIQGETEEDIRKSAETLKKLVGTNMKTAPLASGEDTPENAARAALATTLRGLNLKGDQ